MVLVVREGIGGLVHGEVEGGPLLVHGEVEGGTLLLGLLLPGQQVHDEVPGDADHAVTLHHVVPGHHQVVPVRQVPAPGSGNTESGLVARR